MVHFSENTLTIEIRNAGDPFDTYTQLTSALFTALYIIADETENSDVAKKTISTLSFYLGQALCELSQEDKRVIEQAVSQ